jgi:hypothetical protein
MEIDGRVRLALYERFVGERRPPTPADVAPELGISSEEAEAAYRRLAEARAIVLKPGTTELWMAPPLSAVPTAFRVGTSRGAFWGNCIWDGLGVVAMLGGDGTVQTRCPDCDEPMALTVAGGALVEGDGVAHFAVPAARWWADIGFT